MEAIEYRDKINKSKWVRGEWDNEPDKAQWLDKDTGYPCLIVRHSSSGHLCGYVGVAKGHPFFEKGYDECYEVGDGEYLSVHGGLTFAEHCQAERKECESVCHKVEDGEDDNVWWLGFDCAHSDDVYRNFDYVRSECRGLATQLKAVGDKQ